MSKAKRKGQDPSTTRDSLRRSKISQVESSHARRRRRPIVVEAVPAPGTIADPAVHARKLQATLIRFGANWIRDLIEQGIVIVDENGNAHIREGVR